MTQSASAGASPEPKRILVLGATGTIGRATVNALVRRGHDVVCFLRPRSGLNETDRSGDIAHIFNNVGLRFGDVGNIGSVERDGFQGEPFDALVSCMASRAGTPQDAWAVDYQAHLNALGAAKECGVGQMVLVSAICVQKPLLAFQHAKLAFESALIESGLTHSIVRPTAFFKSLSGQIDRLRRGQPFVMFGDGTLTASKPISADDLADYLCLCLDDTRLHNRILPIGGPGRAITPREQGERLFELLGRKPRFRGVPVMLMDTIIRTLDVLARVRPSLANKAELARIGRYYGTESMLVLDPQTGQYSDTATPSHGVETLFDYYQRLIDRDIPDERGEHAVF